MNASEQRIADMHSVLNILNVLLGELSMIQPKEPQLLKDAERLKDQLDVTVREIKEGEPITEIIARIRAYESAVIAFGTKVLDCARLKLEREALKESLGNLESIFAVFRKRLDEFEERAEDPDIWVHVEPCALREEFEAFFGAIAKNSKGRYQIYFNLARQERGDYYFDLKFEVRRADNRLWIPLRLIDVLRDLAGNARKYSPPGGRVALALYQDEDFIHAAIEDSGCGIPEDEIEKVSQFGYRASNVRQRPTFGGGFGLTKAVWLVTSWGGSLRLQSEADRGTMVRISIPNIKRSASPKTRSI
ncbi:MAG: sensor histidine kinase [Opitutales bacterium]